MDYISYISLAVSLLAFGGGVYTYFVHDKRLKEQQALLNDLNIEKLKRENREQAKADVRVSLTIDKDPQNFSMRNFYNDSGAILVTNFGKATAYNIRIRQKGYSNIICYDIEQLAPNEYRVYHETWESGKLRDAVIIAQWDDECGKNRSNTIKL